MNRMSNQDPLAYLVTFTCYGTWLHGEDKGSVDRAHNEPGSSFLPPSPSFRLENQQRLRQAPYYLDAPRRRIVLCTIQEVCTFRKWMLLAAHVRTNHVHLVVHADVFPEKVLNDVKAYASRRLNESGLDSLPCHRWTRHGSTRYLWNDEAAAGAIHYVVSGQGEPLDVFEAKRELTESRA